MKAIEKSSLSAPRPGTGNGDSLHDSDVEIVEWTSPNDARNPYNWPRQKKVILTAVALFATFTMMMNGTIVTIAHEAIGDRFHVSDISFPHSYWVVTSWTLGGALFSFMVLPMMEDFGIRNAFLLSYLIFLISLIPQAVAHNFATIIVTRFFSGGCVAIIANSTSSVIGNIWADDRARTIPMSLWITLYLMGSSTGPVVGAAILKYLSWRWITYCQLIWYGLLFPLYWLLLSETRGDVILAQIAKDLRTKHPGKKAYSRLELSSTTTPPLSVLLLRSVQRPLYMLLTEPVALVCTLMAGLIVGNIYLFTQSVEQVFAALYGWDPVQAGFAQVAVVVGEAVGWCGALVSAQLYFASAQRNTENPGTPIPEARLYASVVAGFVGMAGGMFVYAWTSYPELPWVAPAVGLAMVGAGNTVVIIGFADYVVDAYAKFAGSAIAAVSLGENVFAAFLPLAAQSMYTDLGFRWASSLLGFLSLVLAFAPVVLIIWGKEIRARSPFMKEAKLDIKADAQSDGDL